MKTESQKSKKLRASVLAGLLAAAMLLTGTFAWRSMSQKTRNEIMDERNPGGRVHDDFNGLKNKDVYAENFTDEETGAPVFARIKLLEYMEIGTDAGVKRDETGRQAEAVLDTAAGQTYANINDTNTWSLYDPTNVTSPFREYWDWTMGGKTIYMPTFNKNKDSLSVDVNGTYVGPNGDFDDVDPYQDYVEYTAVGVDSDPTEAYYDADDDIIDEYDPTANPPQKPGAGGVKKATGVTDPDYEAREETHTTQETLEALGIITMTEWVKAGKPVCNKWVYDDTPVDQGGGWFYWPEPILPQTATGLLLDKVTQRQTAGEKSYYAIEVVGEFATAGDWGDEAGTGDAQGFYGTGFSDKAKDLLDQAASVIIGKEDGKWYLPEAEKNNLYKEIKDDEGKLSGLISAGMDAIIGTADDRADVVTNATDIVIDGKNYGKYYLPATAEEPYYRVNNDDKKLGTKTDTCYWLVDGAFPTGTLETNPVTSVTVTAAGDATQVKNDTTLAFSAEVVTANASLTNKDVTWSVSGSKDGSGTTISDAGVLSVKDEDVDTVLTVTATSKLDGRKSGSASVTVVGKVVTVAVSGGTQVRAGSHLDMSAAVTVDGAVEANPAVTWAALDGSGNKITGVEIDTAGKLTVADTVAEGTKIQVTAAFEADGRQTVSTPVEVTVLEKNAVTVTPSVSVSGATVTSLDAGTSGKVMDLSVTDKDGKAITPTKKTWSVETKAPGTFSLREADPETLVTISTDGKLTIGKRVPAGTGVIVTCEISYADPENSSNTLTASGSATLTVAGPDTVTITNTETKIPQGGTLKMTANVTKSGKPFLGSDVTWSISGNTKATIDANTGVLTVNDEAINTVLKITATSVVDNTVQSVVKTLTVVSATPATVEITPLGVTRVNQGSTNTLTLKATVKDIAGNECENQNVTWSMTGGTGTTALNVTGTGNGNATLTVDWDQAYNSTLTITATSVAAPQKSSTVNLGVDYAPAKVVEVTSNKNGVPVSETVTFTATVWCDDAKTRKCHSQAVTWSTSDTSKMEVTSTGDATGEGKMNAFGSSNTVTITATSKQYTEVSGSITIRGSNSIAS